jgi:hypothetical protein
MMVTVVEMGCRESSSAEEEGEKSEGLCEGHGVRRRAKESAGPYKSRIKKGKESRLIPTDAVTLYTVTCETVTCNYVKCPEFALAAYIFTNPALALPSKLLA